MKEFDHLEFMMRKEEDHIGLGSYTKRKETEIRNSKCAGFRRKEEIVEKFNENGLNTYGLEIH